MSNQFNIFNINDPEFRKICGVQPVVHYKLHGMYYLPPNVLKTKEFTHIQVIHDITKKDYVTYIILDGCGPLKAIYRIVYDKAARDKSLAIPNHVQEYHVTTEFNQKLIYRIGTFTFHDYMDSEAELLVDLIAEAVKSNDENYVPIYDRYGFRRLVYSGYGASTLRKRIPRPKTTWNSSTVGRYGNIYDHVLRFRHFGKEDLQEEEAMERCRTQVYVLVSLVPNEDVYMTSIVNGIGLYKDLVEIVHSTRSMVRTKQRKTDFTWLTTSDFIRDMERTMQEYGFNPNVREDYLSNMLWCYSKADPDVNTDVIYPLKDMSYAVYVSDSLNDLDSI